MREVKKREGNAIVYIIVGLLGLAASALGYAAEANRTKVKDVIVMEFGTCNYPSSPANILGYIAAFLIVLSQIIINVVTRCGFYHKINSKTHSTGEIVHLVISWVASAIGIALLLAGAILRSRQEYIDETGLCYTVQPGLFGGGGVLALVACVMGSCAYNSIELISELPSTESGTGGATI